MVTATTIDKKQAIVKLFIIPEVRQEVEAILGALKREIELTEIETNQRRTQ